MPAITQRPGAVKAGGILKPMSKRNRRNAGNPQGSRDRDASPHRSGRPSKSALAAAKGWIWGWHTVTAALANPERPSPQKLLSLSPPDERWAADWPQPQIVERPELDAHLPKGAVHQGLAALYPPPDGESADTLLARPDKPLVVLDQITDPQNIGAIFRSAAAFGAGGLIVQDRHTPEFSGALAKAAVGTLDTLPFARVTNISRTLDAARDQGWRVIGLAGESDGEIADILDARPTILVMGSEGKGLRRLVTEHCDVLARIPMAANVESLNVSVAAGIALYALAQHRRP